MRKYAYPTSPTVFSTPAFHPSQNPLLIQHTQHRHFFCLTTFCRRCTTTSMHSIVASKANERFRKEPQQIKPRAQTMVSKFTLRQSASSQRPAPSESFLVFGRVVHLFQRKTTSAPGNVRHIDVHPKYPQAPTGWLRQIPKLTFV